MIVRTRTIRFSPDRSPDMRRVKLGFEGDNMVERLEFVLPVIADKQTATMMLGGAYANAVTLELSDNGRYAVNLTKEIIGTDGEVEAYIRIDGEGGEVWQSGVMRLVTGELPDVETEIEERFPTAVETMLTEIAGHRAEMTGTLTEAQAAAERAEAAAERAENAEGGGGSGEPGEAGEDGGYYTPSVRQTGADTMSVMYMPSKDDMPSVSPQTITLPTGPSGRDGSDGQPGTDGKDGVSPTVTVSKSDKVTTISITDENGTKTATINDGYDGAAGRDGTNGEDGVSPTIEVTGVSNGSKVTITDANGTHVFVIPNGTNGKPGEDGVSATHSWDGSVLTVTSASGSSSADLRGPSGTDGKTPVKGTDYWTEADRAQMVSDVLAALPDASEVEY